MIRALQKSALALKLPSGIGVTARQVIAASTFTCIAVSLFVICAWILHLQRLTSMKAGAPGMVLDTALSILFGALGLWLVQQNRIRPVRVVAFGLLLIGSINIPVRDPRLSLHQLAFPFSKQDPQMAQGSAVLFVGLAIALFLLTRGNYSTRSLQAVALIGTIVSSFGLMALVEHATGLNAAPWWGAYFLKVAIPTAACFSLLGLALIASFWERMRQNPQQLYVTAATLAIFGLLLLFGGVDAAVLATADSVLSTRSDVRRNSAEIMAVTDLVDAVRKAESGQRGYLLTGEIQYLRAFQQGRQSVADIVQNRVVNDKALLSTASAKLTELQRTVDLEAAGRHAEALQIVRSSQGLLLMEQIDAQAEIIKSYLTEQLWQKLDKSRQSGQLVQKTVMVAFGVALLLAIVALLFVSTEIRRRSRAELILATTNNELREQTAKAEEASRAKSSFLASMSHEIRTPMNAILGMADMLWESELAETQRHYVEVFRRAGGNLLVLINDILDLSKIEAGNFGLEQIDFDLQETVEQAMEILSPRAEAKGLSLMAHIQTGTSTDLIGDPTRLQQVLLNLMGNAIKFTAHGEVILKIRSHQSDTHATLDFEVSDTGIGIPTDKLSTIFEDFTQAESSTTRRFGGTGLGLGISRRLIQLMSGELRVLSELHKGSTFFFTITLPMGHEKKVNDALGPAGATLTEVAGAEVLIVDNNATNRVILGEMCSAWGMNVTTCDNGREAINLVSNRTDPKFAVALVDRVMPEMDGFETALGLQELCPEIKILIISSDSQSGDVSRCQELGLAGHLMKPIRRAELLRLVTKALHRSKPQLPETDPKSILQLGRKLSTSPQRKILVAEDSEDNRFLLQVYCKGTAYDPTFAEDGQEALLAYQSGLYDLIVMDMHMPTMDGLTATRRIRSIEQMEGKPRIPILALTANALVHDVEEVAAAGCDTHLAKPISKQTFLTALDQWHGKLQPTALTR